MRLHDFVKEIWDIAVAQNADVGVAKDMFLANVLAGADNYPGAEADYAALKAHYDELNESNPEYAKAAHKNYWKLVAAYQEKRYEDMRNLMK